MSFTPPKSLKELMLYCWRIIDRPLVQKEFLINYLSFDLSLFPLNKTKRIIQEAIKRGYLHENNKTEQIRLTPPMKEQFEQWQTHGFEKMQKMRELLKREWRVPMEIDEEFLFQIFRDEVMEQTVQEKAKVYRGSYISLEEVDFDAKISGTVKDYVGDDEVYYPFVISKRNRTISHTCPMFKNVHKDNRHLCVHLARTFSKLKVKDSQKTFELLENIVDNKNEWDFNANV